jgi:hypothetical protein
MSRWAGAEAAISRMTEETSGSALVVQLSLTAFVSL